MALVLIVCAVPAGASAVTHELIDVTTTEPPPEGTTIGLTGTTRFNVLGSGTECEVHASYTPTAPTGTTGHITLELTLPTCKNFGTLAACTLIKAEPTGLPWMVNTATDGTDPALTIEKVFIDLEYNDACKFGRYVDLNFPSVYLVPKIKGAVISTFKKTGEGFVEITDKPTGKVTSKFPAVLEGSLTIQGVHNETFKIIQK